MKQAIHSGVPGHAKGRRFSPSVPCPICGSRLSVVIDKREARVQYARTRRRRVCPNDHRYTTYETVAPEQVVHGWSGWEI